MSQKSDHYTIEIDLTAIENDQIPVTVFPPASSEEFVEYQLPKIVPGTYSISDFGRFVTDFAALDTNGDSLEVENLSTNRWKIANGGKLNKITYKMHDSRDAFENYNGQSENIVFEPGGTDFQKDELFVLNTFGVIGYLKGMTFKPYEVTIIHGASLFGSSALEKRMTSTTKDVFTADDYNFLADGPILYCAPDTVTKQIANAKVLVSVYSPNKLLNAEEVMDNLDELMVAQAKYLGGELPVDRYAFLINLFNDATFSLGYGALEHSYSSLYNFPEGAASRVSQSLRDIASHEFFHIVTPLNIHSEEIGAFDYINPKMSKHLWLYEGVTEYSSMHVQVKYGLNSPEIFLEEISRKMSNAEEYPSDISFTEMSKRILEEEYEPMYGNVYEKGALIGMCLDLYLLKYSNGKKDLPWLMRELTNKYGKDVSFKDEELFDVITQLTYPEVSEFFDSYVSGIEPLPFQEVLGWVGIDYEEPKATKVISLGRFSITGNEKNQMVIADISLLNEFGKKMGFKNGDAIININGESLTYENTQEVIAQFKAENGSGDKVYMIVEREIKGKLKSKKLKAKAIEVDVVGDYIVTFSETQTDQQKILLQKWISAE
ncbi:MAG: putative metalloprotease with PDZ domain [Cyclobacteriaceae bacterium]|jgi:predicted metalloprotease with PDZ domain